MEGEKSAPVQPAPLAPPPFTAQSVTADDAWGLTPWDRKQCRAQILALRNEGLYTPPSVNGSVLFPSDSGGSNWGGVAYDPESGLAVVNSTNVLRSQKLAPRKEFEASGGRQKTAGRSSAAPDARYAVRMDTGDPGVRSRHPLQSASMGQPDGNRYFQR